MQSRALLLGALLPWAVAARAQEQVRPEKGQYGKRREAPIPAVSGKIWSGSASVGMVHDNNIRHLLINSPVDSNIRLPDNAVRTEATVALTPNLGPVKSEFSYEYQRDDYLKHPAFNYYSHSLGASLFPHFAGRWSLDIGGNFDYIGDQTGEIANSEAARLGAIWRGPGHLRLRAGYEYGRDEVPVNALKDSSSNIFYANLHARPSKSQTLFASYHFRANSAAGSDFSYRSSALRAGLISHWTRRFKTTAISSYALKDYNNMDSRFLTRRNDRTFTASLKPTLTLLPWLDAVAAAAYLDNRSNVSIKSYSDQIYSFALQVNF